MKASELKDRLNSHIEKYGDGEVVSYYIEDGMRVKGLEIINTHIPEVIFGKIPVDMNFHISFKPTNQ